MSSCSDRPSITSPSIHFSGYSSEYSQCIFVASRIFSNPVKERKSARECDEYRFNNTPETQPDDMGLDSTAEYLECERTGELLFLCDRLEVAEEQLLEFARAARRNPIRSVCSAAQHSVSRPQRTRPCESCYTSLCLTRRNRDQSQAHALTRRRVILSGVIQSLSVRANDTYVCSGHVGLPPLFDVAIFALPPTRTSGAGIAHRQECAALRRKVLFIRRCAALLSTQSQAQSAVGAIAWPLPTTHMMAMWSTLVFIEICRQERKAA